MPWNRLKSRTKHHIKGMAVAAVLAAVAWTLSSTFPPGMVSYLVTLPACIVVIITALARINDIRPYRTGWVWQARRVGLALCGAGAAAFIAGPFSEHSLYPTWIGAATLWGLATSWVTSPNMPPWWAYISGKEDSADVE